MEFKKSCPADPEALRTPKEALANARRSDAGNGLLLEIERKIKESDIRYVRF